jgi:hypothetical protein
MGEVAQVPTQWSAGAAAVAVTGLRAQKESRNRKGILALIVMAVLGLSFDWLEDPSYCCFVEVRVSRIVARVAEVRTICSEAGRRLLTGRDKAEEK